MPPLRYKLLHPAEIKYYCSDENESIRHGNGNNGRYQKGERQFRQKVLGVSYSTTAVEANMCRAPKPWDGARMKTEQAFISALGYLEEPGEGEVDAYEEQQQGSISLKTRAAFVFTGPPATPLVAM